MQTVLTTFEERTKEIELYYSFLSSNFDIINKDLNKILRSNLILMLYNLVESTISNAIEEIHNEIYSQNVTFDSLNIELKKVLIKQLKNNVESHNFVTSIDCLALDIVKKCFQKKKISTGNIDNNTVAELARKYGFKGDTSYENTRHSKCLIEIKGRRNDLAHGIFSFTEVGKEYTLEDLNEKKNETIAYLTEIIQNIDKYLVDRLYSA